MKSEKKGGQKMGFFSAMIKLEGKLCLVVGAGVVAERKIRKLLQAGAKIKVISPQATKGIRGWASENVIEWDERQFQKDDVEGATLVVAATNVAAVNMHVFQAIQSHQWINMVDRPDLSTFIFPAVLERGGLHLSVSTTGGYPGLAKKIRQQLEGQFGPEYAEYLSFLAAVRQEILSLKLPKIETTALFQEFLQDRYYKWTREGKLEQRNNQAQKIVEERKNKSK